MLQKKINTFVNNHIRNGFVKVSGANGLVTIAKSILTIIANKIVSTTIGTSGIAIVGQLQNFVSIITLVSNGGYNLGLTKYIADNKNDNKKVGEFVSTAFIFTSALTSIIALSIIIFSKSISSYIFNNLSYFSIVNFFALSLMFYNVNSIILSIVNGFQNYRKYFAINITTTVVGFILTVSLVLILREYGALLAIVLSQTVVCLFSYFYVKNEYWIKELSYKLFSREKLFLLLKYSSVTLLAAILWPVVDMLVRTYIIKNISSHEAGLWQATRIINDYIVNIAIGSFSIYLLPRLTIISNKSELKAELLQIYKIIFPVTLLGFGLFYLLRDVVILILYSNEFLKVGDYLLLQMVGSFFWMCRIPLMNLLLAKSKINTYIINEIIFAVIYVILVIFLIPILKVQGIQLAFAIYNFIYLVVCLSIINKIRFN